MSVNYWKIPHLNEGGQLTKILYLESHVTPNRPWSSRQKPRFLYLIHHLVVIVSHIKKYFTIGGAKMQKYQCTTYN